MKKLNKRHMIYRTRGFTLLEVLITLVLLAFGLTALVNLQMKLHMTEMESYQRSQAIVLTQDMIDRVKAAGYLDDNGAPINPNTLTPAYVHPYVTDEDGGNGTDDPLGKGDANYDPADESCIVTFTGSATDDVDREKCEWSERLKGSAEIFDPDNDPLTDNSVQVGGMIDARGCVEQTQAPNWATCVPAMYRVTVVWQGVFETTTPGLTCGQNLYGAEGLRRAISSVATIGIPGCI